MSEIMHLNTEKARLEPDSVFSRPLDIVHEPGLSRGQKIAALERWNQALQDRIRATDEGMAPPAGQTAEEATMVQEIGQALKSLQGEREGSPAAVDAA
jgi:hypothetical protein